MSNRIDIKKSLKKAYRKLRPTREEIELLRRELNRMLDEVNPKESEEYHKGLVKDFLKKHAYSDYFINTKDRSDLVIHNGKTSKTSVGVIIEAKNPSNKTEMPTIENLNKKATQELLLYFLRERVTKKNIEIKHLIVTNLFEWFIFDAREFEKIAENAKLKKHFKEFEEGRLLFDKTEYFYKDIAALVLEQMKDKIEFVYFDVRDYETYLKKQTEAGDKKLIELQKILSPIHLLKLAFANDSNTLNKNFYSELLHIIGLEEYKDRGKKLIRRKTSENRDEDSLIEAAISEITSLDKLSQISEIDRFGENKEEQLFNVALELVITWINRVLFLKLLESQVVNYHNKSREYFFLSKDKVPEYDDLNTLFFKVLAIQRDKRARGIKQKFPNVPYLNSSLFEPTELEKKVIFISNLPDDTSLQLYKKSVLKNGNESLNTLEYLLRFLDAYDFSSEGPEDIVEENKNLISASVLGLIFEKINGYSDGSYFTPGFVTMYMCRETIRRAVVQKFKKETDFDSDDFNDLVNYTLGKYKKNELKKYNSIINSLKICDPAVGSGHFLVSALNEIISIKATLGILADENGKQLKEYLIDVENDELMILCGNGEFFSYVPQNRESSRIQKTLFHEKQTIIENCLFGIDINPNSVNICRLRLWIELLKNAYYKESGELETLPNIDINIKCGNSLINRYPLDADLKEVLRESEFSIDAYRIAADCYRNAENKEQKRSMEKVIERIKGTFTTWIDEHHPQRKKLAKLRGKMIELTEQGRLFQTESKKSKLKKLEKLTKEIKKVEAEVEDLENGTIYRNAFEWRFEFPEVLDAETGNFIGFDIVIMNPPYGIDFSKNEKEMLKSKYEHIVERIRNSFLYFLGLAHDITRDIGILSVIQPNEFLFQIYMTKARRFFVMNSQILYAINMGEDVFEAIVPTCIVSLQKHKIESYNIPVADLRNCTLQELPRHLNIKLFAISSSGIILSTPNSIFSFNLNSTALVNKLSSKFISFGDYCDDVANGISTSCDEIYIVTYNFAESNGFEKKYLKQCIRGGQFNRFYCPQITEEYILYITEEFDPIAGKNILRYLEVNRTLLIDKCVEKKKGSRRWNVLFRSRYEELFIKPKILIRQTADKIVAAPDIEVGYYCIDSVNIVLLKKDFVPQLNFLVGLLNSSLLNFYYREISQEGGRVLAQVKPQRIRSLPIPTVLPEKRKPVERLVERILTEKQHNPEADTSALERKIDELVYVIYGLTNDEIKIVEESTK